MKLSFLAAVHKDTPIDAKVIQQLWEDLVRAINLNDPLTDEVNLTTQASTSTVDFNNVELGNLYRLTYYLETTTVDGTAGTLRLDFAYQDNSGSVTLSTSTINLAAASRTSGVVVLHLASSGITYTPVLASGAMNNARYGLRLYLERLGG